MKRLSFLTVFFLSLFSPLLWGEEGNLQKVEFLAKGVAKVFPEVPNLSSKEIVQLLKQKSQNFILVDVRTQKEQDISIIPGAISKEHFEKNIDKFKGKKVIAYCTIGFRSSRYVEKLLKKGHNAFNLWGSILAWAHEGGELVIKHKKTKKIHTYSRFWNLLPKGYEGVYD